MEETVLFNRGNSVSSGFDYDELSRKAEIEKAKRRKRGDLIIAKDTNGEEIAIFYADDSVPHEKKHEIAVKEYKVLKVLK